MAKVVSDELLKGGHGNNKHKWEEWCNGQTWQAKAGEDFTGEVTTFRQSLYRRAAAHGFSVAIRVSKREGTVTFRFTPKAKETEGVK